MNKNALKAQRDRETTSSQEFQAFFFPYDTSDHCLHSSFDGSYLLTCVLAVRNVVCLSLHSSGEGSKGLSGQGSFKPCSLPWHQENHSAGYSPLRRKGVRKWRCWACPSSAAPTYGFSAFIFNNQTVGFYMYKIFVE